MNLILKNNQIVTFNHPDVKDAEKIINYMQQIGNESDFLSFGSEGPQLSIEDEINIIKNMKNNKSFMIVFHISNEIAGIVTFSINETRKRMYHFGILGISCLEKFWNIGLGTLMMSTFLKEAKNRNIKKINLEVRSDNKVAINLYKKFNFLEEGTIKKKICIDNIFYNSLIMGLEI